MTRRGLARVGVRLAVAVAAAVSLGLALVGAAPDASACSYHAPSGARGPCWGAIIRDLAHMGVVNVFGRIEAWPPVTDRTGEVGVCGPALYGEPFTLTLDPVARLLTFAGPDLDAAPRRPWEPPPLARPLPEPWAGRLWGMVDTGLADFVPITVDSDPIVDPACNGDWVAVQFGDASLRVHRGGRGREYRDATMLLAAGGRPLLADPQPEPLIPCEAVLTVGDRTWKVTNLRVELLPNGVFSDER